MTFAYIVGLLTIITSLAVKVIGYPAQIIEIRKTKSVKGVSFILSALSVLTYLCWTIYGILQKDRVVVLGQSLGVIMSIIVLLQVVYYRRTKD